LKSLATVCGLLTALSIFAGSLHGHHATPLSVDRRNPVTLRGTVAEFALRSPHASLTVDVRDDSGEVVEWTLEGGSIRGFIFTGFTPATLPVGQEVTVVAFPSVTDVHVGQLSSITLPDGKRYGGGPDPEL
jgi:hypothetical protein